jgi:hypothetical protein
MTDLRPRYVTLEKLVKASVKHLQKAGSDGTSRNG